MSSFEQAHPSSLRDKLRREWMMAALQPKKVHIFVVVTYTNRFCWGFKNVQNRTNKIYNPKPSVVGLAHADQHHYALMDYICSPLSSQLSRGKNERGKKKHDANFPTLTLFDTHAEQKQTGQQIIVNGNLLPHLFFCHNRKIRSRGNQ